MILFCTDGNRKIGFGHIMRCLSIADAGKEFLDQESLFILFSEEPTKNIRDRGYECIFLNENEDKKQEIWKIQEVICKYLSPILFVDSYYVDFTFLSVLHDKVRQQGGKLIYIDDIMSFAYPCDILVNYNIYGLDNKNTYEKMYKKEKSAIPRLLLGTSFVPLRAEFLNMPRRKINKKAKRILISTGGADPEHIALKIARYLAEKNTYYKRKYIDFQFDFIIGSMNNDYEKIKTITTGIENIFLHYNVINIWQLMEQSDVAVSASGSTLYELCATQTPTITYFFVDNQRLVSRSFEEAGILCCMGDVRNMPQQDIPEILLNGVVELAIDYERRKEICKRQKKVIDGNGARRIIREVCMDKII